ncbi:MAG: copper oxidase [Xanthomonadales bacterium]|nr:copper oxidase [Xanthomonadales bacterium]
MDWHRRGFLKAGALAGAGLIAARPADASQAADDIAAIREASTPDARSGTVPVLTPNGSTLPYRLVDGVKVFHLVAEEVEHEFAPGLKAQCWGYNGQVHGPTIEAVEGDHVRIYFTNRLPAPTTAHWHGVLLPCGMDGVGGLTQAAIPPGETWVYEWQFRQHGTLMYHAHHDEMTQMAMGLMGMLVVHPREPKHEDQVDRDFALLLSQWKIEPGTSRPDPNEMSDFNVLTFNARCYPGTEPLVVKTGDRVRLRFGNLSAMHHHPIHLHGHLFTVTGTDGGTIPPSARYPDSSVLVPVGTTRTVEFVADNPGDWAVHCHMTHHVMNQMGHELPNMVGADPGALKRALAPVLPRLRVMGTDGMGEHGKHVEMGHMSVPENSIPMVGQQGPYDYITMGGMFTILKVRDELSADPGWYRMPEGTQSRKARKAELDRDGIA